MTRLALTGLVAVLFLLALPAVAEEVANGDEGDEVGAEKTDLAALKNLSLASDLVMEAKVISVTRCCKEKAFTGNFRIRLMSLGILKGILGPVDIIELRIPLTEMGKIKPFLKRLTREDNPPFIVFLDEVARFHLPPLFRLTASPALTDVASDIRRIVAERTASVLEGLESKEDSERDSAFKSLVAIGSPAIPSLKQLLLSRSSVTAEEARLAINSIQRLQVDPYRVFQINRKFPCEPVPIFITPLCRETLFRLAPESLVFRINTWDDGNQVTFRVRTSDGREGWIPAKACEKVKILD